MSDDPGSCFLEHSIGGGNDIENIGMGADRESAPPARIHRVTTVKRSHLGGDGPATIFINRRRSNNTVRGGKAAQIRDYNPRGSTRGFRSEERRVGKECR